MSVYAYITVYIHTYMPPGRSVAEAAACKLYIDFCYSSLSN